jgi:YVTN family beta-propeller protein
VVPVADEGDGARETGQEPSLRLVPGEQVPEPRPVPAPESSSQTEVHTRTFLIADVRGYTTFTATRGDEAAAALAARFAAVTRAVVTEHAGRLVELRGDEALVVFTSARTAIRAALALRDRFVAETLADPDVPLPVGMGLDVGEAVEVEGGYRGGALNLAARLCSAAAPGEVLATREVTHLARHVDGVRYLERGRLQLKGLAEPIPVVRVLPDILDAEREAAFQAAVTAPRSRRRPGRKVVIAGVLVLVVLATAGGYAFQRATRAPPVLSTENRVDVIDPGNGKVVEQVPLNHTPSGIAAGAGSLWVTNSGDGTVSRLDADSRQVQATINVDGQPTGVAVAGGFVWVSLQDRGSVAQISPGAERVVATVVVGNQPTAISAGLSGVWVANSADRTISRINPSSGKVSATVDVGGAPSGIAVTADTVWVTNTQDGTVSAIDPGSATLRSNYPVGAGPTGIAAADGAIWVASNVAGVLARLDPNTGGVRATIRVGKGPTGVVAVSGKLWVINEQGSKPYEAQVLRVDAKSKKVDLTLPVGGTPHGLAVANGKLWLTAGGSGLTHRGGTLTVLSNVPASIDPVASYGEPATRILYDGLVGYRRTGGAAGTTPVPDLATSIPVPVDSGKTYAFRLRKEIRYSTGKPVLASDLRRALERTFHYDPEGGRAIFGAIRGTDACVKKPVSCDLSVGVQTDDATGSVIFHLLKPDPEFLDKLTLSVSAPVPLGTRKVDFNNPVDEGSAVPATGPYMVARFVPETSVELVRNPYFREWSRAAKPDGYPDRIVIRAGKNTDAGRDVAVTEVLQGKADVAYGPFADRAQEVKTRYAAQVHLDLNTDPSWMAMTSTAPPFDDVRARRAVNFAVDRDELVSRSGGSDTFRSSCQVLPPGFPGYAPHCPYTKDLAKARRLVAQSGTKGDRVTVTVPPSARAVGQYLKQVLTGLGYDARLAVPATEPGYNEQIYARQQRDEVMYGGWVADYPAASQFLTRFSCADSAPPYFCDSGVEGKIQRALALQQSQPAAAGRLWQQVDRELVDSAAVLPLGQALDVVVTSRRVGNYQHQPGYGVLFDQLWVRGGPR